VALLDRSFDEASAPESCGELRLPATSVAQKSCRHEFCGLARQHHLQEMLQNRRQEGQNMHVIDMIYFWGRVTPDHPAIISPTRVISYAELAQSIESAAGYFELNIRDGSNPVAVSIDTRSTMMVASLGLLHAGFTIVPVDQGSFANLGQTNAKTLIHERGGTTLSGGTNLLFDDFLLTKSIENRRKENPPRSKRPEGSIIFFSSGTTGKPKPVIFDQSRYNQQLSTFIFFPDYERTLVLPGTSINWGFQQACQAFQAGKTVCFSPLGEPVLRMINIYNIDALVASTQQALDLVECQEKGALYSLQSLRAVSVGGAPVPAERIQSLKRNLCNNLINTYGATEIGLAAIAPYELISSIPYAVGFVVPGIEVEIVDASDVVLPRGSEGFVRMRHETRIAGSNSNDLAVNWFYPGDLGLLTVEGALCITGRRDNVLNRGGVKFDIGDIENFILSCPGVKDAGVYSPKSEFGRDEIWGAMVLEPGASLTALRHEIETDEKFGRLIDKIFIVETIPRGTLGKVHREGLAQMLKNMTEEL
jgi:acyl-coenzyme A synthetase/AMP-(fatty) acid ligase